MLGRLGEKLEPSFFRYFGLWKAYF